MLPGDNYDEESEDENPKLFLQDEDELQTNYVEIIEENIECQHQLVSCNSQYDDDVNMENSPDQRPRHQLMLKKNESQHDDVVILENQPQKQQVFDEVIVEDPLDLSGEVLQYSDEVIVENPLYRRDEELPNTREVKIMCLMDKEMQKSVVVNASNDDEPIEIIKQIGPLLNLKKKRAVRLSILQANSSHCDYDYVVGINMMITADISSLNYYNKDMTDVDYFPDTEHITLVRSDRFYEKISDKPHKQVSKIHLSFTKGKPDSSKIVIDVEDDKMILQDPLKNNSEEKDYFGTEYSKDKRDSIMYREVLELPSSEESNKMDLDSHSPLFSFGENDINNVPEYCNDMQYTNKENQSLDFNDKSQWEEESAFFTKSHIDENSSVMDYCCNRRERIELLNDSDEDNHKEKLENITKEIIDDSDEDDICLQADGKKHEKSPILSRKKQKKVKQSINLSSERRIFKCLFIYPAPPLPGGLTVNIPDYKCLEEGEYLNDVIIDFYLKYLFLEVLDDNDRKRTHIFSSHFYTRLANPLDLNDANNEVTVEELRYSGVQRWTKNVNIFEKDFIILPINEHYHWFLAIICFPNLVGTVVGPDAEKYFPNDRILQKPCILVFDSLSSKYKGNIGDILRGYLNQEYLHKMNETNQFSSELMGLKYPKVPTQCNATDCGLYLLQYVEQFFKDPILDYTIKSHQLENWFEDIVIAEKRKEIANLIRELATKFNNSEVDLPVLKFAKPHTRRKASRFEAPGGLYSNNDNDNNIWEHQIDDILMSNSEDDNDWKNQNKDISINDSDEDNASIKNTKKSTKCKPQKTKSRFDPKASTTKRWNKTDGLESKQFNDFLSTRKLYGNNKETYHTIGKNESLFKLSYNRVQSTHNINKNESIDEDADDSFEFEENIQSLRCSKNSNATINPNSRNFKLIKLGQQKLDKTNKAYHNKLINQESFIRKNPAVKQTIMSQTTKKPQEINFSAAQDNDKFYKYSINQSKNDELPTTLSFKNFKKMKKDELTVD